MDRPGIVIIRSVGVRFVRRNEKHFTGRDGESASINFGPTFSSDAKNQNALIKPVSPRDPMPTRFGIPSDAFDMQKDTERMAAHLAEQIGGQEMNDLASEPLCLRIHGR
jgi:hypothetical protein